MEGTYGIGFFLNGHHHILCQDGDGYHFHQLMQNSHFKPVKLTYYEARTFIETHPLCANISKHDIRIMLFSEIGNVLHGRSGVSTIKSLAISDEEEEEEPLH